MLKSYFLCTYSVFLIFACTFIGDKTLFGISIFFPFWVLVLLLRKSISKGELLAQSILLIISPLFLRGVLTTSSPEYYNFFFMAFCYINVIPLYFLVLDQFSSDVIFKVCVFYLCFFGFGLLATTSLTGSRGGFIFGPNVLYRQLSFFFAFSLVSLFYDKCSTRTNWSIYSLWLAFAIFMAATLSRGAIVVLLSYALLFFLTRKGHRVLVMFVSIAVASVIVYLANDSHLLSRLLYFDLENNSEAYRFSKYIMLAEFYHTSEFLLGLTNDNYLGMYPHNFILELIFYFGFLPSLILFLIGSPSFFCREFYYLAFILLGVILGAMLSGDMLYNFPLISLLLTFLIRIDKKKPVSI